MNILVGSFSRDRDCRVPRIVSDHVLRGFVCLDVVAPEFTDVVVGERRHVHNELVGWLCGEMVHDGFVVEDVFGYFPCQVFGQCNVRRFFMPQTFC